MTFRSRFNRTAVLSVSLSLSLAVHSSLPPSLSPALSPSHTKVVDDAAAWVFR